MGSGPPLKNHKNIGFLCNTGPDPEKSQNYQARMQSWVIIGTPAKRHLNGVSLAGRCWPTFSGIIWIPSPTKKKVGPPLEKTFGSAHEINQITRTSSEDCNQAGWVRPAKTQISLKHELMSIIWSAQQRLAWLVPRLVFLIYGPRREKNVFGACKHRMRIPPCASVQSDRRLCFSITVKYIKYLSLFHSKFPANLCS